MDKKAIAFNAIVIAGISVVVLTIIIIIFTSNIGNSNKTITNTYQQEIAKTKLEQEKQKCTSMCKSGDTGFLQERSSLKQYQQLLGLTGLHCYDIVEDSNCNGDLKNIGLKIGEYYATG
jgi:hypothetical protein